MLDDYEDDDGFAKYIPKTRDPGQWLLGGVCLYAVFCIVMPVIAAFFRKRGKEEFTDQASKSSRFVQVDYGYAIEGKPEENPDALNDDDEEPMEKLTEKPHIHNDSKLESLSFEDALDDVLETGTKTKSRAIRSVFPFLRKCMTDAIKMDEESKEIMKLGIPFTIAGIAESVFSAFTTILVSKYLDVEALSAFVVTNVLVEITDAFVHGVSSALDIVCPHAIGNGNHKLAGQYVQISATIYFILSIPIMLMWWFLIDDCVRLMGMSEEVVTYSLQYAHIVLFHYMFDGVFTGFDTLLDSTGYAIPGTIYDIIMGFLECITMWLLLAYVDGMDLFWLGLSHLVFSMFSTALFLAIVICRGWLDPFLDGMCRTFALKNKSAVKNLCSAAVPLSIGSLLEHGQWQLLTFFATGLGSAEVVAWGILATVWEQLETVTEGFVEAGEIRLSLHLGAGNIELSKRASSKLLWISTCLSSVASLLLFAFMQHIPGWFTDDETLQMILIKMLPMVGIGNILMSFGMVSWALIGAQGRYNLATGISAVISFGVTIPLAATFCLSFHFEVQALVGSLVIGYSTIGMCMSYLLLTSDWTQLSDMIREANAEEGDDTDGDSYDNYDWDELPENIMAAAKILGYTLESWNGDLDLIIFENDYDELSKEEKEAAGVLGYTASEWDAESDSDYEEESTITVEVL